MELTIWQQMRQILDPHTNILIALPPQPTTDAIASAAALLAVCDKLGKRATAVSDGYSMPANHGFLPRAVEIQPELSGSRKFAIQVNIDGTAVDSLSYDATGTMLSINLTTTGRELTPADVRAETRGSDHTLIITLDAPELHALGGLFDRHAPFFYHTPILNIDHKPTNTQYGQVNCIQLTATAVSEIVYEYLFATDEGLIDDGVATNLLAGMISKSKSFQSPAVTPRSLEIASALIRLGARREEIIRNLYQTKSLGMLRLWGTILAGLKTAHQERFAWSTLSRTHLADTQSIDDVIAGALEELLTQSPRAEIIAIVFERPFGGQPEAFVHLRGGHDGSTLFRDYVPTPHRASWKLTLPAGSLDDAEQHMLAVTGEHLVRA